MSGVFSPDGMVSSGLGSFTVSPSPAYVAGVAILVDSAHLGPACTAISAVVVF